MSGPARAADPFDRRATSIPGWDGYLTLELSNVANLPITIYPGMKIGQISFFRLTTPADVPYGSNGTRSKYQGQRGADGEPVLRGVRGTAKDR